MSNFALNTTDPYDDVISSVNYLLATTNVLDANAIVASGNALVGNVTSGQITTAADPDYLAYLYQYIDVRYADSATGSVNFSTSPTNRLYFGIRNTTTSGAGSSNPADYVWTQVVGGFGTTKFLYYQTNGGRQIQFSAATSPPSSNFVIVTDATSIDLDVLSATLVASTLSVFYSNGQLFNRNTAGYWSPNAVGNIVSTVANSVVIRSNAVVAQVVKTINYNTAAKTWSVANTGPDINSNSFTFSTPVINNQFSYFQPFVYNDIYANLNNSLQVSVVESGANGANAASLSVTYNPAQILIKNGSAWTPNIASNGYVQTVANISVTQNANSIAFLSQNFAYDTLWNNSYNGGSINSVDNYSFASFYANGNLVVSGSGTSTVDLLLIGGGAGSAITTPVSPNNWGGNGGQVQLFSNITVSAGTYPVSIGRGGSILGAAAAGNTTITIANTTYTASSATMTGITNGGYANNGAGSAPNVTTGLGGIGEPDPWNQINWLQVPPGFYGQNIYDANLLARFGAGGGSQLYGNLIPETLNGAAGGAGVSSTSGGNNVGILAYDYNSSGRLVDAASGIYGGGGKARTPQAGTGTSTVNPSWGLAIVRLQPSSNNTISNSSFTNLNVRNQPSGIYANLSNSNWAVATNTSLSVNANTITSSTPITSNLSFTQIYTYADTINSLSNQLNLSVLDQGQQGSRGFVPLAYVVTSSDPTSFSNAQYTTAFSAPRANTVAPIGTGFAPITGDTAQFIYTTTNAFVVKTFNANTNGWTTANGQVISGNLIVTGTITSAQLNTNDIYTLNIQSTNANIGNVNSNGFWLQSNTGDARFGGNTSIGNNLTVGNNATIGGNLFVSGLITTGNLNNNTVNTTTITANAISFFAAYQSNSTLTYANVAANTYYQLSNTVSITTLVANTKIFVSGQVLLDWVANVGTTPSQFSYTPSIRMFDGSVGVTYTLTDQPKNTTDLSASPPLVIIEDNYIETGINLTLSNVATYNFALFTYWQPLTGNINNIDFLVASNRRLTVQSLKR